MLGVGITHPARWSRTCDCNASTVSTLWANTSSPDFATRSIQPLSPRKSGVKHSTRISEFNCFKCSTVSAKWLAPWSGCDCKESQPPPMHKHPGWSTTYKLISVNTGENNIVQAPLGNCSSNIPRLCWVERRRRGASLHRAKSASACASVAHNHYRRRRSAVYPTPTFTAIWAAGFLANRCEVELVHSRTQTLVVCSMLPARRRNAKPRWFRQPCRASARLDILRGATMLRNEVTEVWPGLKPVLELFQARLRRG